MSAVVVVVVVEPAYSVQSIRSETNKENENFGENVGNEWLASGSGGAWLKVYAARGATRIDWCGGGRGSGSGQPSSVSVVYMVVVC